MENEEHTEISNLLEEAKADYRSKTKKYLRLRGGDRVLFRVELRKAREKYHSLEIQEIKLMIASIQSELKNPSLKAAERKKLEKNLEKLMMKKRKFQSRLSHHEWLAFTRSVWRFKEMESNVRIGSHPAQFSAEIPRRCIKLYSYVGETILDPFVGVGTTLVQARKLRRKSIGIDISPKYVSLTNKIISQKSIGPSEYEPTVKIGDARDLGFIPDESVHLIITHPPYFNAVRTSETEGDLSHFEDTEYSIFLNEMDKVFSELERVLKEGRVLVIVTGDIIRKINGITQQLPIHADYINMILKKEFVLWNVFIYETKIRKSGGKPTMGSYPFPHKLFSQIAHNYVLVFRKLPR